MRNFFLILTVLLITETVSASRLFSIPARKVKVACIGNSVTLGLGLQNQGKESYPSVLADLLGNRFEVRNFGRSGATLLSKGHNPYIKSEEYRKAIEYQADIVVIDLGLNDTDPRNWPDYQDEFIPDYQKLIRSFKTAEGDSPAIYTCLMTPVFPGHPRFKSGTRDWFWAIQECIRKVALNNGAFLVDLHTPLYRRPDLFADNLHPDKEGAAIIARTVYSSITGDYGGFTLSQAFGEHMVVQQKKPVIFNGSANRGDKIGIRLDTQYLQTKASNEGRWMVSFSPLPAGGPYSLQIMVNDTLRIDWKDILSGEVWFCSGQSNMAFELKNAEGGKNVAESARDKELRLFNYRGFISTDNIEFDKPALDRINHLNFFEGKWQLDSPEVASDFSAIAYFFGRELRRKLKIPVGLVEVAVGGAPLESFIDRKSLEYNPVLVNEFLNREKNDFIMDWVRQRVTKNISLNNNEDQRHPYDPAYIFEAGILPWQNIPVQGVIWYQGESNAHNPELYKIAFTEFVHSWRRFWNNDQLPFFIAQLSSLDRPSWPRFRDVQRQLADSVPHTALVVTSDMGDSLNVHPVRKKQVGERFAFQALNRVYGLKVISGGPLPLKTKKIPGHLTIFFAPGKKLKTSDGNPIRELEIAGTSGVFKPVNAKLYRNKIVMDAGEDVEAVRYGWKPFSHGNLVNEADLPASTFLLHIK